MAGRTNAPLHGLPRGVRGTVVPSTRRGRLRGPDARGCGARRAGRRDRGGRHLSRHRLATFVNHLASCRCRHHRSGIIAPATAAAASWTARIIARVTAAPTSSAAIAAAAARITREIAADKITAAVAWIAAIGRLAVPIAPIKISTAAVAANLAEEVLARMPVARIAASAAAAVANAKCRAATSREQTRCSQGGKNEVSHGKGPGVRFQILGR